MSSVPQDLGVEASGPDVEKQVALRGEGKETMTLSSPQSLLVVSAVDPTIEARVLRKLDFRVPTLLAFLCTEYSPSPGRCVTSRPSLLTHWQIYSPF